MSRSTLIERRVFVIMPFVQGGTRNETQLNAFFENNIKKPIETADLKYRYRVYRSGQSFDITSEIIRDLCRADVVVADLTGTEPNPNVMYELGVRLAISESPVILIRENLASNKRIFDIFGFFAYSYDPLDSRPLEQHLVDKLRRWETGEEPYANPVLRLIRTELALINPNLTDLSPDKQRELVLHGIRAVSANIERAFGPNGMGIATDSPAGLLVEKRGTGIVGGMKSGNPFEEAGVRLLAEASQQMLAKVGDGTKLPILLADALIQGAVAATQRGFLAHDLLKGISAAIGKTISVIQGLAKTERENLQAVAKTAAKHQLDIDVVDVITTVGERGAVSLTLTEEDRTTVEKIDHMELESGVLHPEFVSSCPEQTCTLDNCAILLYTEKISPMGPFLPILETVAKMGKPLLVIAGDVEGESLATLIVNKEKLKCAAIRLPNHQRLHLFQDIAVLTGAAVINPYFGQRLEGARKADLGGAERVIVGLGRTEIIGGHGAPDKLAAYVDGLIREKANAKTDYDKEVLKERIAHLAGTTVKIRLGATTRQDLRDKVYRTQSALNAAVSAIERGCVPGGGRALLFASRTLDDIDLRSPGEREGILIAKNALMTPFRVLVSSTRKDYLPIEEKLLAEISPEVGYNVRTAHIEDLAAAGILDPLEVVVAALETAQSVSRIFIETGSWQVRGSQDPTTAVI